MTITEEITLPGFQSDVQAFGYQLANFSPVPHELNLFQFGLDLIYPEISFSHLFPGGRYIAMYRSLEKTISSISKHAIKDGNTWNNLFNEYDSNRSAIISSINSPPTSSDHLKENEQRHPTIEFER